MKNGGVQNTVIEKFEELKFYGKCLMAVQNASKSCEYFKTRKIDLLVFENLENFEQFESKLESNWHWPKMRKNDHFLIKNEFQRPRFGGGLLGHKKRGTFVVGDRFSSMEIVSEPATPALKRRLRRNDL